MITNRTYGIDNDVLAYNARIVAAGNQSLSFSALRDLNQFVISIKKIGLWHNMICWPLRANQNAGIGSTAYSLGGFGIYNGTLNATAFWSIEGVDMTTTSPSVGQISTSALAAQPSTILSIQKYSSSFNSVQVAYDGTTRQHHYKNSNSTWNGFAGNNVGIGTPINDSFSSVQLKFNGANGKARINGGTESTYNFGNNNLTAFRMGGGARGAILAFAMIINIDTSENFYSLYRSTLGQGLGLP